MTGAERRVQLEGWRTASAVKLAMLGRRDADLKFILSGLDAAVLRAVIADLADSYWDAIRFSGVNVASMHNAVQQDALWQATLTTAPPTGA